MATRRHSTKRVQRQIRHTNLGRIQSPEPEEPAFDPEVALKAITTKRGTVRDMELRRIDALVLTKPLVYEPMLLIGYAIARKNTVKRRWRKAETVILTKHRKFILSYARDVLQCRWPAGERVILMNRLDDQAFVYAHDVLKGRWPSAEGFIRRNPIYAAMYAETVIKGRWQEAERVIARDATVAYRYAKHVIKGAWPPAETAMARCRSTSLNYAYCILKGRFYRGERAILADLPTAISYVQDVVKQPWSELESALSLQLDACSHSTGCNCKRFLHKYRQVCPGQQLPVALQKHWLLLSFHNP